MRRGLSERCAGSGRRTADAGTRRSVRCRAAGSSARPSRSTSPARDVWRPTIARASVVLPEPDSPTSARHSARPDRERDVVQHLLRAVERVEIRTSSRARGDLGLAPRRRGAVAGAALLELGDPHAAHPVARPDLDRGRRRLRADARRRTRSADAKTHPAAARARRRDEAGDRLEAAALGDIRDRADELARVRVRAAGRRAARAGPTSTTRPAYITSTRCGERRRRRRGRG